MPKANRPTSSTAASARNWWCVARPGRCAAGRSASAERSEPAGNSIAGAKSGFPFPCVAGEGAEGGWGRSWSAFCTANSAPFSPSGSLNRCHPWHLPFGQRCCSRWQSCHLVPPCGEAKQPLVTRSPRAATDQRPPSADRTERSRPPDGEVEVPPELAATCPFDFGRCVADAQGERLKLGGQSVGMACIDAPRQILSACIGIQHRA